jgi:hypothetical protein
VVEELLYNAAKEERHMRKRPRRNHAPAFKAKAEEVESLAGKHIVRNLEAYIDFLSSVISRDRLQPCASYDEKTDGMGPILRISVFHGTSRVSEAAGTWVPRRNSDKDGLWSLKRVSNTETMKR